MMTNEPKKQMSQFEKRWKDSDKEKQMMEDLKTIQWESEKDKEGAMEAIKTLAESSLHFVKNNPNFDEQTKADLTHYLDEKRRKTIEVLKSTAIKQAKDGK